jgi:SPP1 gp7 family putative phage head morphogenesis protein
MAPPRASIPADPDKFSDAVKAFRRRVPVTSDEWEEMTAAEREYAFHVAAVTQARIVQDVFDAIDSAILNGDDFRTFKQAVGPKLEASWGSPNAARVETVFRSNVQRAYSEGRQAIMNSEPVKKARPYWRFDAVGDNRTTDICMERDGVVKPQDDPWWKANTPPLHHRCRSQLVPLTKEEADEEPQRPEPTTPAAGDFGKAIENPTSFEIDWDKFHPSIRNELERRLGKKKDAA